MESERVEISHTFIRLFDQPSQLKPRNVLSLRAPLSVCHDRHDASMECRSSGGLRARGEVSLPGITPLTPRTRFPSDLSGVRTGVGFEPVSQNSVFFADWDLLRTGRPFFSALPSK